MPKFRTRVLVKQYRNNIVEATSREEVVAHTKRIFEKLLKEAREERPDLDTEFELVGVSEVTGES